MRLNLLIILLVTFSQNCFSQGYKSKSKDSIVLMFVNSKEVLETGFKHCNKPDTGVLIILDPNQLLANSDIKTWFGHPVEIISNGKLIDSLQLFDAHYLLKNSSTYFVLRESKSKNSTMLYIHHPFDNLLSYARLRRISSGYILEQIKSGVI